MLQLQKLSASPLSFSLFLVLCIVYPPSRTDMNGSKAMGRAQLDAKRSGKREKLEAAV